MSLRARNWILVLETGSTSANGTFETCRRTLAARVPACLLICWSHLEAPGLIGTKKTYGMPQFRAVHGLRQAFLVMALLALMRRASPQATLALTWKR